MFKLKRELNDEIICYKVYWVIKFFEPRVEVVFNEIFVFVVKFMNYKTIFVMTATFDYEIEQINVKTIFLYKNIKKNIYIEQFTSYNIDDILICKFKKTFYDLKQFSRVWYNTLIKFLKLLNFNSLIFNYVFINERIIIDVYVLVEIM